VSVDIYLSTIDLVKWTKHESILVMLKGLPATRAWLINQFMGITTVLTYRDRLLMEEEEGE
jgi:hypothetical protein